MKVGILTHHHNHNYGAALQALATQITVEQLVEGASAEFINLYNAYDVSHAHFASHYLYEPAHRTAFRHKKAREIYKNEADRRYSLFVNFYKEHFHLSRHFAYYSELYDDCPQYDVYITGADQTWNTVEWFFNKSQLPWFLAFTNSKNKIAYGCGMFPHKDTPYRLEFETLTMLRQYKRIMVREEAGAGILRRYLEQPIDVVLDPSLLLIKDDYVPLCQKPSTISDSPFIFAYFLAQRDSYVHLERDLSEVAKKHKTKVILITNEIPINNEHVTTIIDAGPAEWLWLLSNAEAVLTSSFHGLAFSLIFNKPFTAISPDERKKTLLNTVGLSRHLFSDLYNFYTSDADFTLDFQTANNLLESERQKCRNMLKEALDLCKTGGVS
jgi:hypothetical protein